MRKIIMFGLIFGFASSVFANSHLKELKTHFIKQKIEIEKESHQKREAVLRKASACILKAKTNKDYKICEKEEAQARKAIKAEAKQKRKQLKAKFKAEREAIKSQKRMRHMPNKEPKVESNPL